MNKVILIGRLTRDPEVRYTQSGIAVCTFTLAVDRRFAKRDANDGRPTADFIPACRSVPTMRRTVRSAT